MVRGVVNGCLISAAAWLAIWMIITDGEAVMTGTKKPYAGVAFLAAMNRNFPAHAVGVFRGVESPALATLWGTFGRDKKFIKAYLRQNADKDHALVLYLMNGVCTRKGNCFDGEIWRGTPGGLNAALEGKRTRIMRKIRRRTKRIARFVARFDNPNLRPVLTIALEDNFSYWAAHNMIAEVRQWWPWEIARNPSNVNRYKQRAGADYIELHGAGAPFAGDGRRIVSLDGVDPIFTHRPPTIKKTIKASSLDLWLDVEGGRANIVLLWSALHQGLRGDSGLSAPPKKRVFEVPADDIREFRRKLRRLS